MEYVTTDIGLLQKDNANWLYGQSIINEKGLLRNRLVNGVSEKKAQMYSYFRWVLDDIKSKIPSPPKQVSVGVDELITLMRFGKLEIPYKAEGEKYTYRAKYFEVDKIYDSGRRAFLEKAPKGKADSIDFSDL